MSGFAQGDGGEHREQHRIARHLETEFHEFLKRDGDQTGRRPDADPVRRHVVGTFAEPVPDLTNEEEDGRQDRDADQEASFRGKL